MSTSTIRNYTTAKPSAQTIGEMQANLARHGAARIAVDYDSEGPRALGFTLVTPHGPRHFTMPVDVDAVQRLLTREFDAGRLAAKQGREKLTGRDQATRVAWRVMADWLDAQLTIVAAEMTTLTTVMLPYLHVDAAGHTLAEAYAERESALELGASS